MTNYSPTILSNECSAYFNKSIYPLVNMFERNLRKFLYIKSTYYNGEGLKKAIENLESKDFGEIYDLLFVDDDFCKKAKEIANGAKKGSAGIYSKKELISKLSELEENTTWNKVIGNNSLNYIKENFLKLKIYRNDIMHAHNINYDTFTKAKLTFTKSNNELLEEIQKLITYSVSEKESENLVDVLSDKLNNKSFDEWKKAFENSSNIIDALNEQREHWKHIEESLIKWNEVIKSVKNASSMINEDDKTKKIYDELKEKK